MGRGRPRLPLHVVSRRLELSLEADVAGGGRGVYARALGWLSCVPGGWPVLLARARQATDHRTVNLAGDGLDRLEVARRRYGEAGFDHVDSEPRELVGDLELLLLVERDARRLLSVAERRVEDLYSVLPGAVH